ncbi:MAG TPA: lysylphosphatidylglycerol synthase transmembrane domain-containing protein [Candidatus Methanoperedens sp.]|nr:lysylphosphatidylglycerol synthase transmembrane domain-containing protein [Candidatus Methanoperedens sp.]
MKRRFALGAALGAFFLWLALRNVSLGEIAATLRGASLPIFVLFILMHVGSLGLRAARWRLLVQPLAPVPARRLLPPLSIGFMVNFLFPGRAGEVVRVWLLGRREGLSVSAAFATVVVERLFDGLAIICFLAPAPFLVAGGDPALMARVRWAALLLPAAYVVVLAALYLLGHHREALTAFLARHPIVQGRPLLARGVHLVERFCEGLGALRSWRALVGTAFFSLLIWGVGGLSNALMLRSIGLDLPGYAPFFLLVMQAVGVLIPTPGFVGPFQYAHVVALGVYGVPRAVALSAALLIHAGLFIAILVPGFWFAAREHLGLRELSRASRSEGE